MLKHISLLIIFDEEGFQNPTYIVEEIVGSLNLVPVEEVGLAELKLLQVIFLHEGKPGHIEDSKQPAPTRTLLVAHWLTLTLYLVIVDVNALLQTP